MNVQETKNVIESELKEIAASFGNASALVQYSVEVSTNKVDDEEDITYIFGSLSLGRKDASDDERLYLPLDAELDDNGNVDGDKFKESLESFRNKVAPIRDRLATAENPEEELKAIITDFDRQLEDNYKKEIERLNRIAKRNLTLAIIAVSVAAVAALLILVIDKIA